MRGLVLVEQQLNSDETVQWHAEPATKLLVLDLGYRAALWWTVFPCIVPMINEQILIYTILIMAAFARLDYKKIKKGHVYVLTNERAFFGKFNQKGEFKIEERNLNDLVSVKKTPFTRTIKMKFRMGGKRTKEFRFPYVQNPKPAIDFLLPYQQKK